MTVLSNKSAGVFAGIALSFGITLSLHAQQKTVSTLQSIIVAAQAHLPLLLEKKALINSANASVTDAVHSRLPVVKTLEEVSASSSNSLAGAYFPLSTIPSVSGSIRNTNNFQPETGNIGMLYSEYDLFDFGLNKAMVQNAQAFAGLAKSGLERELYLLKWQTGKTYFELLQKELQLGIDKQNINRYQEIYKVIQALTLAGIRPGADSSQVIAELSATRVSYNSTQGKVQQLQQQLAYVTGIQANSIFVDTTVQALSIPVFPAYNMALDSTENPFLSFYTSQTNYYKANQYLIKKSYQPRIILLGGAWARGSSIQYNDQYKDIFSGIGYQRFNYAVAFSFIYNLFDAVHRRDKLAVNQYKITASDFEFQQQQQDLLNELEQSNITIGKTEKNLQEMPVQLQAAKDAYAQKLAQYNAGTINLIDLTNASFILYRAQTDYVEVLNDWYLSNLNKAALSGNIDQFIQLIKK